MRVPLQGHKGRTGGIFTFRSTTRLSFQFPNVTFSQTKYGSAPLDLAVLTQLSPCGDKERQK
jgi:hypothetical protein